MFRLLVEDVCVCGFWEHQSPATKLRESREQSPVSVVLKVTMCKTINPNILLSIKLRERLFLKALKTRSLWICPFCTQSNSERGSHCKIRRLDKNILRGVDSINKILPSVSAFYRFYMVTCVSFNPRWMKNWCPCIFNQKIH